MQTLFDSRNLGGGGRNRRKLLDQLTRLDVVQANQTVKSGRCDDFAAGIEADGVNAAALPLDLVQKLAAIGLVNAHFARAVQAAGDDESAAIGIEVGIIDSSG